MAGASAMHENRNRHVMSRIGQTCGVLTPGGRMDEERRHGGISDRPRRAATGGCGLRSIRVVGSCSVCCVSR